MYDCLVALHQEVNTHMTFGLLINLELLASSFPISKIFISFTAECSTSESPTLSVCHLADGGAQWLYQRSFTENSCLLRLERG